MSRDMQGQNEGDTEGTIDLAGPLHGQCVVKLDPISGHTSACIAT